MIISAFEARYSDGHVVVTETNLARDQLEWLRRDEIDLPVMRLPVSDPDVVIGPVVSREARVLAVAADHPLARRGSVSVEDLGECTTTTSEVMVRVARGAGVCSSRRGRRQRRPVVSSANVDTHG